MVETREALKSGKTREDLLAEGYAAATITRAQAQLRQREETPFDKRLYNEDEQPPDSLVRGSDQEEEESATTTEEDDSMVTQQQLDDQLTIRDQATEITQLKEQLTQASVHQRLGSVIAHAGEACADCQTDLSEYRQGIITKALEEIDPAVLRQVAVDRGVLPRTLTVTLP